MALHDSIPIDDIKSAKAGKTRRRDGGLCSKGTHVGVQYFKTNLDEDCDDEIDHIGHAIYVDLGGVGANDWELVYKRISPLNEIESPEDDMSELVKSAVIPWVTTIGHPEAVQQTIRIDGQSQSEWQSTTNPPYKFITLKDTEATHEDC